MTHSLTPAELRSIASAASKLTTAIVRTYATEDAALVGRIRAVGDAVAAHDSLFPEGPRLPLEKVRAMVGVKRADIAYPAPADTSSPEYVEWEATREYAAETLAPSKATVGNWTLVLSKLSDAGVSRTDGTILATARLLNSNRDRAAITGIVGESLNVEAGEARDAFYLATVRATVTDAARERVEARKAEKADRAARKAREDAGHTVDPVDGKPTTTPLPTAADVIAYLNRIATEGAYSDDDQDAINSAMSRVFESFAPVSLDTLATV